MKMQYDREANAAYIQFSQGPSVKTRKLDDLTLADFSKNGKLIGLEILDATKRISPQLLKKFVRIDK